MARRITVGIDEVGRGAWAGPLVACAVVLPIDFSICRVAPWKLNDSKLLSKMDRQIADVEIRKNALAVGLGWVTAVKIDEIGLTMAVSLAMQRALQQIDISYDEIIIDGNYNYLSDYHIGRKINVKTVVKADQTVPAVSAASIVAKVTRDNFMAQMGEKYMEYGFEKHVGYGTLKHKNVLQMHGITNLHRKSFKPIAAFAI